MHYHDAHEIKTTTNYKSNASGEDGCGFGSHQMEIQPAVNIRQNGRLGPACGSEVMDYITVRDDVIHPQLRPLGLGPRLSRGRPSPCSLLFFISGNNVLS